MLRRLREALRNGPRARARAYVIASPRSGTTWIKAALNAHPEVLCTEGRPFGGYFDVVQDRNASAPRLRITLDRYADALLEHYEWQQLVLARRQVHAQVMQRFLSTLDDMALSLSGKHLLVEKLTPYAGTGEHVLESMRALPMSSRVVELVRDGRDVATSLIFHALRREPVDAVSEVQARRRRRFIDQDSAVALERLFTDDELIDACTQWLEGLRLCAALRAEADVLTIRYEALVMNFHDEIAQALRFLGAEASKRQLDLCRKASSFEAMSGGRLAGTDDPLAHVRKGVVGDWRNYFTRRDGEIFCSATDGWLKRLGYVDDDQWVASLPAQLAF